ncbi:MAG TPA: DEAD/DEAH box helicase family protein [Tepidanaerobacter syntrophicus]|uniref:DEAD/DEAH box helicase family protein n=1 Tax=Tepidanaerobacter syntrophicus TaxID=224999 RepID=UPI001774FC95|nr:DEAD/DEAH box helicase family protein [Tepidanaerobacter syntrophicus]HHV84034.1 DEAD/DEAH box helicase family protein [Tepidanaerobacter syntrophicus]
MNFKNLDLKMKYRSSSDDVVRSFFIPVLKSAKAYKRAVGFFSSSSLIAVSKGMTGLVKNEGKIYLIASPYLQEEDIEAINKGYEERNKVIERALVNSIHEPKNYFERERLNLLAHLIANEQLDMKIALVESDEGFGIYHEKIGIVEDFYGNKVAFTGSLNDSLNAFVSNFESIDVFCSWKSEDDLIRVLDKESDFDNLWSDATRKVRVLDFPKVAKEKLQTYKSEYINLDIDKQQFDKVPVSNDRIYENKAELNFKSKRPEDYYPKMPEKVELYDYQKEAIDNWEKNNYRGIFNMATGTGKTITGLSAVVGLAQKMDNRIAVIIVCPFQHLVEQWVDDIRLFNMDPIVGYSSSKQRDWKDRLSNAVIDYNLGIIKHFCFITTNATYATKFVQNQINKIEKNSVIIVDEAHNFGAINLSKKLNDKIPFRLALSATLERYDDPEGTEKLYTYFGKECINYPLERAIKEKKLTPYYYYPKLVYLSDDELNMYQQLSRQLARNIIKTKTGKMKLSEMGKMIAIKRARLVAGAVSKLNALKNYIKPYANDSHILVYCGATTISDADYVEGSPDQSEMRQIEAVSDVLGNELKMKISQFTSRETAAERELLKREFEKGEKLQVLVAIRCLDEGVNIPKIKTAFILASSTNPKEYIQRRGRVLRRAEGKKYAEIYDFVTIPRPLEQVKNLSEDEIRTDISLVRKEIERVKDFADISSNPHEGYKLIDKLTSVYNLDRIQGGELYE